MPKSRYNISYKARRGTWEELIMCQYDRIFRGITGKWDMGFQWFRRYGMRVLANWEEVYSVGEIRVL